MNDFNDASGAFNPLGSDEQGHWLLPLLATRFGAPNTFVPRGFEAYARILHPIVRDRPKAPDTWQTVFTSGHLFMEVELVSWASVAAVQGKRVEKYTQGTLVVPPQASDLYLPWVDAQGWRYGETIEGNLEVHSLARVAVILARYRTTPASGVAALWEGWGSGNSERYSSSTTRDLANTIGWLTGGMSAKAPRARALAPAAQLKLAGRTHHLYSAGIAEFIDPGWPICAPWVRDQVDPHSPNILWPADHAWVLATEVDYDSTIVAGSRALVSTLLASQWIEALEVEEDVEEHLLIVPGACGN